MITSPRGTPDILNAYLRSSKSVVIHLKTLESLRLAWLEMGMREGYKLGEKGIEITEKMIKAFYRLNRGPGDEGGETK